MSPEARPEVSPKASTGGAVGAPAARAWVFDFLLLAALWGSSFLFMRLAVVEVGVWATAGLRIGIAAAVLVPLVLARGLGPRLVQHWRPCLVMGALNSAIPFACICWALQSISTGLSAILNATVPLFGAVVAWFWLRSPLDTSRVVGLVVGFAGVALLASGKASFVPDASGLSSGLAVIACLVACLCYGLAASYTKVGLADVPPLVTSGGSLLAAAVLMAPAVWLTWPGAWPSWRAIGALLAVGVLCTALAYVLFFRLLQRAGPTRALAVTFVVPVFAMLYGALLLDEAITAWMLLCGTVIACGTALSTGLVRLPQGLTGPRLRG